MKRISQNKFASSLFSCLGVAACVAFSSCGKKDNDKFKSADEFEEFLQDKAKERGFIIDDDKLTKFANDNWKTASKKTFQFPEEIKKKQIVEEDLDNEDEELHGPEQQTPKQTNPEQQNPGTEQPNPATASPATATITNDSKLSELINKKNGEHAGIKVNDICFDLNVFFEIYKWFEDHKGGSSQNLISSEELKLDEAINMLKKCNNVVCKEFGQNGTTATVDTTLLVNQGVCKDWQDRTISYFKAENIEVKSYNSLLYLLLNGTNLGFSNENLSHQKNIGNTVGVKEAYEALVNLQNR